MKAFITVIAIILLYIYQVPAQKISVFSLTGKNPLSNAHISCVSLSGTVLKTLVTNSNGVVDLKFLNISGDKVIIHISMLGYEKVYDTVNPFKNHTYYLIPHSLMIDECVITGQYAPNSPQKSVHRISVIDNKKIEATASQNLRDVLNNEMNIRLSQDNVLGSSMSMQGISGQNVKILIDGVPVTGRLNGNIDISQINMNNVERIEIIEGPLSVNYGTDALAGTINIITRKSQKESFTISSNNYYESNGQYNFSGRIGYSKNKNIFSLSGGRNFFDGWSKSDDPFYFEKKHVADSTRFKEWKPKEQYFVTFYAGRYIKELKLSYTGNYFYERITNRGLPRLPYNETAFDDYYKTNRISNAIDLTGPLNTKYYINVLFAFNHFKRIKNTYYKDLTTLEETLTQNSGDQDTSVFNNFFARGSISTTKDSSVINYELGYDINSETGSGLRIKDQEQQINDYAIFGTAEYKPFSALIIRPGIRVTYNTAYKAPLIPSINFLLKLNQNNSIRFSYARGFRAPSVKELYFIFVDINHNIIGNENLKAEYSHNFSLSITNNTKIGNTQWKTENSYFYNSINNMISLVQSSGTQYSYFNIDKFQSYGVQLQTELMWKHLRFTVGGAYIGRYNQLSETYNSDKFTYSPEAKCNLVYEWQKLSISFFYKYTGILPMYSINSNNEIYKTQIKDYHTADIAVSKQFLQQKLKLSIGSKNIFNVKDVPGVSTSTAHSSTSSSMTVGMGRTYFVKLDINLSSKK